MSEEILNYFKEVLTWYRKYTPDRVYALNNKDIEMLQGLLDLYIAEKEKNKELENYLQMAKQIMTVDISEDFDCMKLKEFKEYLLNEMKLNENFEE